MQEAYLIINTSEKKLIDAEAVEYSDFSKIFQCPECNATLHWRSSFIREGHLVRASFVHPKGNLNDCSLRVDFGIDENTEQSILNVYSKGQNREKLEKSFLKCLHHYQAREIPFFKPIKLPQELQEQALAIQIFVNEEHLNRQIRANERIKMVYAEPFLLIEAASKILESSQAQKYLENRIVKFEEWLTLNQQAMTNVVTKIHRIGGNIPVEDLIKYHSWQLTGIIRYIQSSSNEFRREFLRKIFWGDSKLPVSVKLLWGSNEIETLEEWLGIKIKDDIQEIKQQRSSEIKKIAKFSIDDLKAVCKDANFLNESFIALDKGYESHSNKFIKFVLLKTWKSIKFYDWSVLPEFYT